MPLVCTAHNWLKTARFSFVTPDTSYRNSLSDPESNTMVFTAAQTTALYEGADQMANSECNGARIGKRRNTNGE